MTTIALKRIAELTDADWSVWLDIQQRTGAYESPYFRPEFAQAVARVRNDVEVAVLSQDGQTVGFFPFQRGKLNLGRPLGGKLSDYHGPLVRQNADFSPQQLVATCKLATWDFDHLVCASDAFDPFITARDKSAQMNLAEGFEGYMRGRREAGSDTVHRQGQKTRKMAREVGPLQFAYDADDKEAFSLLCTWKSAQYVRTGLADVFSFPWTLELIRTLRGHRSDAFSAPLTVLRAGSTVAAVCLSLRSQHVLHGWFTAYNPELQRYSPGLTLFVQLAEEAEGRGIRKIDLGRGDERYKWSLASSSVEVGEGSITSPSLSTLLRSSWRKTRDWAANSSIANRAGLSGRLLKPLREWLAYH